MLSPLLSTISNYFYHVMLLLDVVVVVVVTYINIYVEIERAFALLKGKNFVDRNT